MTRIKFSPKVSIRSKKNENKRHRPKQRNRRKETRNNYPKRREKKKKAEQEWDNPYRESKIELMAKQNILIDLLETALRQLKTNSRDFEELIYDE